MQAWFKGLTPALNDVSLARELREGEPDDVGPSVMAIAKAFVFIG
ncbi:MAG: hypothetical protein JWP75_3110 [Frondihabitans sp.]|nr:hypothetical protein [Frondihabitans sp.]